MISFMDCVLLITIIAIVYTAYWYLSVPKNLPPGPLGIPLLGSSLDFWDGSRQHYMAQEKVKKYGPLFKMYIANKLVIVLGDYEIIHEAMVKQGDIFSGRPQMHSLMPAKIHHHGVILSEGELWKEQRRFALATLRDFGVGRPILEPRIREELELMIEHISEYSNAKIPFDPQKLITCAVSNIINALIFGRRFNYDDEEFVHQFMAMSERASGSGVGFLSPFLLSETLSSMLSFLPVVKQLQKSTEEFVDFIERETQKTMSAYDPDSEPCNYIHSFMKASKERQGENFSDVQLLATVFDLFAAGTESTSSTLRWALLFLAHHPDVQEKMYDEIKDQLGVDSTPDYADRSKLPFTEAVIMETQRCANLAPFGVLRRTLAATKLMGYDIPEDSIVVALLANVLHNPDLYPKPKEFDPYRFFANGKLDRDPKVIPFQIGKRICLGEALARMELFILLAGLISRFRFYFPNDEPVPTAEPIVGIICTPVRYRICAEARNE